LADVSSTRKKFSVLIIKPSSVERKQPIETLRLNILNISVCSYQETNTTLLHSLLMCINAMQVYCL